MSVNPNLLIIAPSLEMYFVDKTTGFPLSKGLVYFYSATSPSVAKNIYDQNGNALNNPVVLSSVGTFQDNNGNNIVPFYYLFSEATGVPEKYYIEVYSSLDGITPATLQFTRNNWPPPSEINTPTPSSITTFLNEIPNGQFLAHNNGPVWSGLSTGQVVNNATGVYNIAPGGWTFERPASSAAIDLVTFSRFSSSIGNPTGNPRYALTVNCTSPSGADAYKRVCIRFNDVNKFSDTSSEDDQYTFSFTGISTGSATNISLYILQNFGSGGSSQNAIPIGSSPIVVSAGGYAIYKQVITFPATTGFTIGSLDDDSVQIAMYLPTSSTFNVSMTDFILTLGDVSITGFVDETNADMLTRGVAGWMPTPDPAGMNNYLPVVMSPTGFTFSDADIGKIFAGMYNTLPIGEIDCDGTQYLTEAYSTDGIPYARLQAKWFSSSTSANFFGNGANYAAASYTNVSAPSNSMRLSVTSPGAATITDVNTGFSFTSIDTGLVTGCVGYLYGGGAYVIDNVIGTRTAAAAGTSGFVVTNPRNSALSYHVFTVNPLAASLITPGTYFTFTTNVGNFYMWFKVDGAGANPSPGGTGIQVNLLSTYTENEVARIIEAAISGSQTSAIIPLAGSAVVTGSNFTITTPSATVYYVWYKVDGIGTDPQPGVTAPFKILVNVASTDTIAQVNAKTITAINTKYFATPDLRGQFLRGWDNGAGVDLDIAGRFSKGDSLGQLNLLGSFQLDDFFSHLHSAGTLSGSFTTTDSAQAPSTAHVLADIKSASSAQTVTISGSTALTGGNESVPVNAYVRWVTKY